MPEVTIGFVPRERFSIAARSLERLFQCTVGDFRLIVVDACTPPRYWSEIERLLTGRANVDVLRTEKPLFPNASKKLVAEASETELTCFMENDSLVSEGWLPALISALREKEADVAVPLVEEGERGLDHHGIGNTGYFDFRETPAGTSLEIISIGRTLPQVELLKPQLVDVAESHCLLLRSEILRRVQPFDEFLNTREFLDISLRLREAGARMVFQPQSRVTFVPPPPVEVEERPFFFFKWDYEQAVLSHQRIAQRWKLASFPNSLAFVTARSYSLSSGQLARYHFMRRLKRRILRVANRVYHSQPRSRESDLGS